ncbi:MAG TPA: acyl-CoA thioesterase II [Amycolatopsis sp.]|nr:acyl-CoA thioesterase II [Amycolatopsis sp.]
MTAESATEQRPHRDGADLAALLALEPVGPDLFRTVPDRTATKRMFGGLVAGQALFAAGRTVTEDRQAHSLHAHFLRGGDSSRPVDYRVERVRDGGSFSTRRVTAVQNGTEFFTLTASFQVPEDGWAHQTPRSLGSDPDTLLPGSEVMAAAGGQNLAWFSALPWTSPLEVRFDGKLPRVAALRGEVSEPRQRFWFRARNPLPSDPVVHAAAATFASDTFLLSTALAPHASFVGSPELVFASLDHAVWFHRAFRADEWLHYEQESIWAGNGRGLCRGLVFDRDGVLVASVTQEALIRRLPAAD